MSPEPLILSEEDIIWSADDVEKSLLHNEINDAQKTEINSRGIHVGTFCFYLVLSFTFGVLISFIILFLSQVRPECGCASQDSQWGRIPMVIERDSVILNSLSSPKFRAPRGHSRLFYKCSISRDIRSLLSI